ncbi:hypothetical protein OG607_34565 [Streptomyces sp. NBC_01537]|uniref:hypothetical protein n=1 Tax=Streptomyces sp. NBC_01537 TaxID=2903896 RepID=UPI003868992E
MTDLYGAGSFDDFLLVYALHFPNRHLDIDQNTRASAAFMAPKSVPALRRVLAEFGVLPENLVQWGGTDNADSFYWVPAGPPEDWPTIVVEAGQLDFMVLFKRSSEVVLQLLEGVLKCPFFPDDFPTARPEFIPGRIIDLGED